MKALMRDLVWSQIVDLLSLGQLVKTQGDGLSTYRAKALKAKKISKSLKVHVLSDQLIGLCDIFDDAARFKVEIVFNKYNAPSIVNKIGIHLRDADLDSLRDALFVAERDMYPAIIIHS